VFVIAGKCGGNFMVLILIDTLEGFALPCTLQRWFSRLLLQAMEIQRAIRRAVIERCEPWMGCKEKTLPIYRLAL
jgi:hypothetical protein